MRISLIPRSRGRALVRYSLSESDSPLSPEALDRIAEAFLRHRRAGSRLNAGPLCGRAELDEAEAKAFALELEAILEEPRA